MPEIPKQVEATDLAIHLIRVLREKHGPLMFHQSGGCCDGSSPMCYPRGEFMVGDSDIQLGEVDGEPFYMSRSQFEYWKHTHLTLDVVPGRGGMFSLDGPRACASLSAPVSSMTMRFANFARRGASNVWRRKIGAAVISVTGSHPCQRS